MFSEAFLLQKLHKFLFKKVRNWPPKIDPLIGIRNRVFQYVCTWLLLLWLENGYTVNIKTSLLIRLWVWLVFCMLVATLRWKALKNKERSLEFQKKANWILTPKHTVPVLNFIGQLLTLISLHLGKTGKTTFHGKEDGNYGFCWVFSFKVLS